jgi:hypothetical protein
MVQTRDNPQPKLSDKNDANDWSGQRRPDHGKFDYVPWAGN